MVEIGKPRAINAGPETKQSTTLQSKPTVDLRQAQQLRDRLAPDGQLTIQTFDDSAAKRKELIRVLHGTLEQHEAELRRLNGQGAGVFIAVNKTDGRGRSKPNIVRVRAVCVDLDGSPLKPVLECALEPHVIVESSPGRWHVWWRADGLPLDQFKGVQRTIAEQFGGDKSVCDLPRVMRLPGFIHRKGAPFRTRLVKCSEAPPYSAEQILREFPPAGGGKRQRSSPAPPHGSTAAIAADPVLQMLDVTGRLIGPGREPGMWRVRCPWAHEHTNGDPEAAYLQPFCGGRVGAGFVCLHDHCTDRGLKDLLGELGLSRASNDGQTIDRLARLDPLDYDRVRVQEAETAGVRVSSLDAAVVTRRKELAAEAEPDGGLNFDPPEPWPEPVNGAGLADEIAALIHRHVVLSPAEAVAVVLWVLHAHAHSLASISAILAIQSPEKRCGKTTLLTLLQALVPKPLPASNITPAALFRSVEKWQPTLLIDEADTFLRGSDELRGVLNSGHSRTGAFVIRTVGDDHDPTAFATWSPKAIALIGYLPDTLTDRAIIVSLRRKHPDERAAPVRADRLEALADLPRRCARWVQDNTNQLRHADPAMPGGLHDRASDNWRALLAIADALGGDWPEQARRAAAELTLREEEDSAATLLLEDICALFAERGDRLASETIVSALAEMEHRPWPEWCAGRPITARGIAKLLRPFGIAPGTIRVNGETPKGYRREQFSDAFRRYLVVDECPSNLDNSPRLVVSAGK